MKKAAYSKGEFSMALLAYRSAPQEATGVSPAQLLMGRQLKTSLPSPPALLQPKLISRDVIKQRDAVKKETQSYYYNSRNGALDLTPLSLGDKVLVRDMDDRT